MFSRKFFLKTFLIICTSKYWGFFALFYSRDLITCSKYIKTLLITWFAWFIGLFFVQLLVLIFKQEKVSGNIFATIHDVCFSNILLSEHIAFLFLKEGLICSIKFFFLLKLPFISNSPLSLFFFHFFWNFVLLFQLKNERKIAVRKYFYSHLG